MKKAQINFRISPALLTEVKQAAIASRLNMAAYIRQLIVDGIREKAGKDLGGELADGRQGNGASVVAHIPLSRGLVALVDIDDFERVNQHKWSCLNNGAAQARIGKTRVQMHRFILNLNGDDRTQIVDHINHNKLDNRRCNLRVVTQSQNQANRVPSKDNNLKFKGVIDGLKRKTPVLSPSKWGRSSLPMKRYRAQICCQGIIYKLGGFPTPEMAARAYDRKALELFGEFALLNFPESAAATAEA